MHCSGRAITADEISLSPLAVPAASFTFNLRAVNSVAEKRQTWPRALKGPKARNSFIVFPLVAAFLFLNSWSTGSVGSWLQTGCLLQGFLL